MSIINKLIINFILLFVFFMPFNAYAETNKINIPSNIELDERVVFRINIDNAKYINWNLGDGNRNIGNDIVHRYNKAGNYSVILRYWLNNKKYEEVHDVFVYDKSYLLLTDFSEKKEDILNMIDIAKKNNIHIKLIDEYSSNTDFLTEEILSKKLISESTLINSIQNIIVYSKTNVPLQALSRFLKVSEENILTEKNIIIFTPHKLDTYSYLKRQYNILKPKKLISTSGVTFLTLIESKNIDEYILSLKSNLFEFKEFNESTSKYKIWNFISYFTDTLIISGVPDNTVLLLLLLPVIATIISIFKQVIGLSTFGIYTPTIITLTFLVLGLKFGLLTFFVVGFTGMASRYALRGFRLSYIPKMAIVMIFVAISLLLLLMLTIKFKLINIEYVSLIIFPLLVMATLVEKFVTAQFNTNFKKAINQMFEVILISLVIYYIIGGPVKIFNFDLTLNIIKTTILAFPEIIILLIIFNIFLGRWTGLRLVEYIHYKDIINKIDDSNNEE